MRLKKGEIKRLIEAGTAIDITNKDFDEDLWRKTERVGVSMGSYGMNGGVLKDRESGQLYAITKRNTALFQYF